MSAEGRALAVSVFGEQYRTEVNAFDREVEVVIDHSAIAWCGLKAHTILIGETECPVTIIGFVTVSDEYRHEGVGTALMAAANTAAKMTGTAYALLNAGNQGFYERLGYVHPPNLPAVWMVKCLTDTLPWLDEATVDLQGAK